MRLKLFCHDILQISNRGGWRRRQKIELLKMFGQNYVQWPIFGAAGAENFVKFRYFSEKSPNFVKTEDFIAQLCIKWRKKSRKPLYIGYFFEFCSVTTFSENPPVRWPKPRSPPPQCDPWLAPKGARIFHILEL